MTPKIGVLLGGSSAEREVSLRTGEAIYNALIQRGYKTVKIDTSQDMLESIKKEKIDLAFLALHGPLGEDGCIQGMLEVLGIPYTGSGVLASAMCMDKVTTKMMLRYNGLPTPNFIVLPRKEYLRLGSSGASEKALQDIKLPLVIKAPTQGSTIGIKFVRQESELEEGFILAYQYGNNALVEEMIDGVEITASVLGNDDPVPLSLIEIVSTTGVYDYESKYTVGLSHHIMPPRIPDGVQEKIKELAVKAYQIMGCRGLARVDFMVESGGDVYILEINTLPGMTETSLFPDAARDAGIDFPDLVLKIMGLALENR